MGVSDVPALAGVHHLKLPVTDLARSREWYRSRLGYELLAEMVEQVLLMGLALADPTAGPGWACGSIPNAHRRPPDSTTSPSACPTRGHRRARRPATAQGQQHGDVHWASIGWILPLLHDPDGHEVRFYTQQHHTEPEPGQVTTIHDPRETAERHEQAAT